MNDEDTVASVLYLDAKNVIVTPGVLGQNLALAASIWRNKPWFIFVVAWIHSVWLLLMDVGMLGFIIVA